MDLLQSRAELAFRPQIVNGKEMAVRLQKFLGNGIYTIPEAALYARVSPAMMNRWLFGTEKGRSVIEPQFGKQDKIVSFLDLIQTLAIREIRLQRQVPLLKFRQAIRTAKDRLGLTHPFARQHCTYLMGEDLIIRPPGNDDEFVEASGKHQGQRLFPFVEMYLENLTFSNDGLANKYQIYTSNGVAILMSPDHRFGEPLLPSGYTAMAIWESIIAEGSIERAAKVYGIPKEEAEASYKFVNDHLGKSVA